MTLAVRLRLSALEPVGSRLVVGLSPTITPVVRCPGCGAAVSEWAARCPECDADVRAAPLLEVRAEHAPASRLRRVPPASVAVAVVLLAVAAAVVRQGGDAAPPAGDPAGTTTGTAAPTTTAPGSARTGAGPRRGQVAFVEPPRTFRIVDLRTGRSVASELPVEAYPEHPFALGASFVFTSAGRARLAGAVDPGPGSRLVVRTLGAADSVLPADQPGAVWLVRGQPPSAVEVELVNGSGDRLAPPVELPPGTAPVLAAGPDRLVLQRIDGTLLLYDARARRITDGLGRAGDVLDAHGPVVAWVAAAYGRCEGATACELHLTDVDSGGDRVVAAPPGSEWVRGGAFSPDGSKLAAFAAAGGAAESGAARLVMIDVATVGTLEIPGSEAPVGEPVVAAAWSRTSGWLLYSGLGGSLRGHFPGSPSAQALDLPSSYTFAAN